MFVREFKVPIVMKLWDLLLSVGEFFPIYILYLSTSLIITFSSDLMKISESSELIMYMQKLKLNYWYEQDFNEFVSRANELLEKDRFRPFEYHFSYTPLNHLKDMYRNDFIKIIKAMQDDSLDSAKISTEDAKAFVTASLLATVIVSGANSVACVN